MSRRQFFKLGAGGTSLALMAPVMNLHAGRGDSLVLPVNYFESRAHRYWMKLSHNEGGESRQTRRTVGAALRNRGALRGKGHGYAFSVLFDRAVESVFQRATQNGRQPSSLFELIQTMYERSLYPRGGTAIGRTLFLNLFSLLRGRDGTDQGRAAHDRYLAYRKALLDYKDAALNSREANDVGAARAMYRTQLKAWRERLHALADSYASGESTLDPDFRVELAMIEGVDVRLAPVRLLALNVRLKRMGEMLQVSWDGEASLQTAPELNGPWTDVNQSSPALFEANQQKNFFRTIR